MKLKLPASMTSIRVSNIAKTYYFCEPQDFSVNNTSEGEMFLEIKHTRPIESRVIAKVSADNMSLILTALPPANGGKKDSYEEFFKNIFSTDLSPNLADKNACKKAYEDYKNDIIVDGDIVAKGKPPVHGIDATLTVFFEIPSAAPELDEKGNANFRELNKFISVRQNQLLVRVTPETAGEPGYTVQGKAISQQFGKPIEIKYNDTVAINSDGTEFYSRVDGHVVFNQNELKVFDTLEIKNVDYSTGNIDFVGIVNIKNDVYPGFVVRGKDIFVNGICQGATLIAENNIEIKVGVKGGDTKTRHDGFIPSITAGGNIVLGYCENVKLIAKGDIHVKKYSFNCTIYSGGKVTSDSKATFAGGIVRTFDGIAIFNAGTKANTNIVLSVGEKYDLDDKVTKIRAEKNRLLDSLAKIDDVLKKLNLKDPKVLANIKVKKLIETKEVIEKRVALFERRMETLYRESISVDPHIEVYNEAQEGITVRFFDISETIKRTEKKVAFYYDADEHTIKAAPIPSDRDINSAINK